MLTNDELVNFRNALYVGNYVKKDIDEKKRFDFGNLWFGDYLTHAEQGNFGSRAKPKHLGLIGLNDSNKSTRNLLPITSKKHTSKRSYLIPQGVILNMPKKCDSYVMLKLKLLVRVETLKDFFEYKGLLPDVYCKEIMEKLYALR